MLAVRTRKNPKQRIARLVSGFKKPATRGKIREFLLCRRECCEAASLTIDELYWSNKHIIEECLLSDDADSRKNAVKLIRHMLKDDNEDIKNMARDILQWVFCIGNLFKMIRKGGEANAYSWLSSTLGALKKDGISIPENLFSDGNPYSMIAAPKKDDTNNKIKVLNDELKRASCSSMDNFLQLLNQMLDDEHLKDEAIGIMKDLFSGKNISIVSKDERFMCEIAHLLRNRYNDEDIRNVANDFIRNLFSYGDIDTILRNERFMGDLPFFLKKMLDGEHSRGEAVNIIMRKLLSDENISATLKNSGFVSNLSLRLGIMSRDKNLRNIAADVTEKLLSSNEITNIVLKNVEFTRELPYVLEKIASVVKFRRRLPSILESIVRADNGIIIINKLLHNNKISHTLLDDEGFAKSLFWYLPEVLESGGHKDEAIYVFKKLFFSKKIDSAVSMNPIYSVSWISCFEKILNANNDLKVKMELVVKELLLNKDVCEEAKSWLLRYSKVAPDTTDVDALLRNEGLMSHLPFMIYQMLCKRSLKEKAANIMEKIFSTKENIGIVLKNEDFVDQLPYTFRRMLENEDLKKRTANIINKLLGSDATNEQLKSELNTIISEYGL